MSLRPSETEILQKTRDTDPLTSDLSILSRAPMAASPKTDIQKLLSDNKATLQKATFAPSEAMLKKLLTEDIPDTDVPKFMQFEWLQTIAQLASHDRHAYEFKIACCNRLIRNESGVGEIAELQNIVGAHQKDVDEILTLKKEIADLQSTSNATNWKDNFAKAAQKNQVLLERLTSNRTLAEAVSAAEFLQDLGLNAQSQLKDDVLLKLPALLKTYGAANIELMKRLGSVGNNALNARAMVGSIEIEVGGYIGVRLLKLQIEANNNQPKPVEYGTNATDPFGQPLKPIEGLDKVTISSALGPNVGDFQGSNGGLRTIGKDVKWDVWGNGQNVITGDNQSGITIGDPPAMLLGLAHTEPQATAPLYTPATGDWNRCHIVYFGSMRMTPDKYKSNAQGEAEFRQEIAKFLQDPNQQFLPICLVESYWVDLAPWTIYLSKDEVRRALSLK